MKFEKVCFQVFLESGYRDMLHLHQDFGKKNNVDLHSRRCLEESPVGIQYCGERLRLSPT